jgi:hypothetical protein
MPMTRNLRILQGEAGSAMASFLNLNWLEPRSLSDLGIVGCKSTAAVYFSPLS